MAFTGQLGTADSKLGNFELGSPNSSPPPTDVGASNALALTQTLVLSKTLNLTISQTITLGDRANRVLSELASSTLTLTQSATDVLIPNTTVDVALVLTQDATATVSYPGNAFNALTLSQLAVGNRVISVEITDTLTVTDAARKVTDVSATSTLTLSQDVDAAKLKQASGSNTLTVTHTLTVSVGFSRTINQGLSILQVAGRNIHKAVNPSNTLTANQLAVAVVTHPVNNVLTLSQTADYLVGKLAKNALIVTQSVQSVTTFHRNTADNFIPFQTLSRELHLRRTLNDALALSQTLVAYVVKSVSSILTPSQSISVVKSKPAFNVLPTVDSATYTRSFGKLVTHSVSLDETLQVTKVKSVSAANAFGMNQFARGTRRLTVTAANALALAHALVREYKYGVVTQTVNLDDTLTVSKLAPRTATNTLALSQSVHVAKTLVRTIVDTVTFHNSYEKYVGIGGHEYVSVPAIQVVKVKKLVILQSDELVIVLPAPEFNDSEGGTGRINIKRTMSGGRRVYARDNVTSKLNYQFIMDRRKAIELRNFIMNSNTKFLRMENWKGEIWAVQMTNSPFSFGEDSAWLGSPGGNKSSITLEFEGVRLN